MSDTFITNSTSNKLKDTVLLYVYTTSFQLKAQTAAFWTYRAENLPESERDELYLHIQKKQISICGPTVVLIPATCQTEVQHSHVC